MRRPLYFAGLYVKPAVLRTKRRPFSVTSSLSFKTEELTGNLREKTALFSVWFSLSFKTESVTENRTFNP